MSHLYFNEDSDYSKENTCENEVLFHHGKKLNIFTPQLPIYYIQYQNRRSRSAQMPEAVTVGVLRKKVFFKILHNSQETSVPEETPVNSAKSLRTPSLYKVTPDCF